jgi:large subunit ribosomal protein L1
MVRGVVTLPHGTGKTVSVLALVTPDKEAEAKEAGADYVGLDEYLQKIKDGWTDVDVIVTMPSVMGKLGPLGSCAWPSWFNAEILKREPLLWMLARP